jgi:succinate dehydrogenase hydrophobic anchor subunit
LTFHFLGFFCEFFRDRTELSSLMSKLVGLVFGGLYFFFEASIFSILRFHFPLDFSERWWLFGGIPLIYLLWSMTSHLNIGMRHVFPTYVFFPFAIAACISLVERSYRRFVPGLTLGISLSIFRILSF